MSPIAAPVIAPRPTALPRSPSGREPRFQGAIAACGDAGRYRDVPVDWFDTAAAVWRPTAVLRAGPALAGLRRQAEVLIPDASGTDIREVDIACLRLPRLLT